MGDARGSWPCPFDNSSRHCAAAVTTPLTQYRCTWDDGTEKTVRPQKTRQALGSVSWSSLGINKPHQGICSTGKLGWGGGGSNGQQPREIERERQRSSRGGRLLTQMEKKSKFFHKVFVSIQELSNCSNPDEVSFLISSFSLSFSPVQPPLVGLLRLLEL